MATLKHIALCTLALVGRVCACGDAKNATVDGLKLINCKWNGACRIATTVYDVTLMTAVWKSQYVYNIDGKCSDWGCSDSYSRKRYVNPASKDEIIANIDSNGGWKICWLDRVKGPCVELECET